MATLLQPLGSDKLWTSLSQTILDEGIFGKYLNRSPTEMQPTIQVVIDNNFMTWSAGGSGKRFTINISVIYDPRIVHHLNFTTNERSPFIQQHPPPPKKTWESENHMPYPFTKANIFRGRTEHKLPCKLLSDTLHGIRKPSAN